MAPSILVNPEAFATICLHRQRHSYEAVHGLLVGRSLSKNEIRVDHAVPICHGSAPTKPIVETVLGLLAKETVVGWYTAPLLSNETLPCPVSLRMAANLETPLIEPVLLVVQNKKLGDCLQGKDATATSGDVLKGFGKNVEKQWLEPVKITVEESAKAVQAMREALRQKIELNDFCVHLEGPPSTSWYPNKDLVKILSKS
jgi:hypothetical protein